MSQQEGCRVVVLGGYGHFGARIVRAQCSGSIDQAQVLGEQVATQLLDQGAREILDTLLADPGH